MERQEELQGFGQFLALVSSSARPYLVFTTQDSESLNFQLGLHVFKFRNSRMPEITGIKSLQSKRHFASGHESRRSLGVV